MSRPLRVGLSTCPNDTFLFHALLEGRIRPRGLEVEYVLADVEELNARMLHGELDLSKVSFHAMLAMASRVWLLDSGAALGFGVGPLLLAAPGGSDTLPLPQGARVLAPGRWTTAALLLALLREELGPLANEQIQQVVFSDIPARLLSGRADYGACIHEARFTWRDLGLGFVADLGQLFERRAGTALPLGGLCVARTVGATVAAELERAVRQSLDWGQAHRDECLPTMRHHAQETSDDVLWAHVDLYVNEWTLSLGETGRAALAALERLSREQAREVQGLIPPAELQPVPR